MFNDLLSDSENVVLVARLNRMLPTLTSAGYSTLEEYQASIYSSVNKILALKNTMQPLTIVKGETPALIGDLTVNITNLNNDAIDIVSQLKAVENDTANLFNLGQASQTSIRQVLRQQIYSNNLQSYAENFINNTNIQANSTWIDYISGAALLPAASTSHLAYTTAIGVSSVGASVSPVANLSDGTVDTTYTWNGNQLELILSFSTPQIVNRLVIDVDTYDGLEISSLTSSPDGTIFNDILASLNVDSITMNATSGKYSGAVVIDFPAQSSSNIQIIINNVIGTEIIALRNIDLFAIQYSSSGQLTSTIISNPIGPVTFTSDQLTTELTNIVHQLSYDNVHFTVITPGTEINISKSFWYRALLSRSSSNTSSTGLIADPANSTYYKVVNSTTISLGTNITERTIVLSNVTGPIVLSETPLQTSLKIQVNSTFLNSTQYSYQNNTVTLASNQNNVTIIYQTSGLSSQTQATLQNYYTPILRKFQFKA